MDQDNKLRAVETAETLNGDNAVSAETQVENVEISAETQTEDKEVSAETADKPAKSKAKKIVGWVFSGLGIAVVAFLFVVAVTLAIDKFARKSPVPSFCGYATLIVATGSMSGTIEEGDMIIVKKADEFKIGDIITFMPENASIPTTHRIIRIVDGKYYTKGDANNAEDTRPIDKSRIVGKVVGTVPHVGLFFKWLKEDFGWMYLVAGVAVIVAGVLLYRAVAMDKKEK